MEHYDDEYPGRGGDGPILLSDAVALELERILNWRLEALLRVGYPIDHALPLAADPRVDVRDAEDLLGRGCPPATAVRILL